MLYFLNTQKLGSDKLLTTPSDIRQYTIWETIANTVEERSGNFILFVDEAHHGTTNARGRNGSNRTIVQQFLFGDPKLGLTPVRLVVGISQLRSGLPSCYNTAVITRSAPCPSTLSGCGNPA